MAYSSKDGKKPFEHASRTSHTHILNDDAVQKFLSRCVLPKKAEDIDFNVCDSRKINSPEGDDIQFIVAIDGGSTTAVVQKEFPSSVLQFFQFGALRFSVTDLEGLERKPFIDPDDMAKLKNIQRLKLVLPIRNMSLEEGVSLTDSVRRAMYEFFCDELGEDDTLMKTLSWLIFQEYQEGGDEWMLASCPSCGATKIPLSRAKMKSNHTFDCTECSEVIFLTDVFRLYEAIDDDIGAGGIVGYVLTSVEQIILIHLIRLILMMQPKLLKQILFIKDGPLAFFGQTANMHKPVRSLVKFLFERHDLFMAGLEKSGGFVEHADEIQRKLEAGTILVLNNKYIYTYITPGKADESAPYGSTSYYSNKVIFKSMDGRLYVVTIPTDELLKEPAITKLKNIDVILDNVAKLKCDMYDNALVPVALANKLVSLANHPSSRILQQFAIDKVKG